MTAAVEMDVLAGPEAEGARRATGASGPGAPGMALRKEGSSKPDPGP
jgi:hypothetical protein